MAETDDNITPHLATTDVEPAAPFKDADVALKPIGDGAVQSGGKIADAKQAVSSSTASLQQQAVDKARLFAEDGKAKAGDALDQFAQLLIDAAGQIDQKLGAQYGEYARSAATSVQGLADTVREKDVDELADDVRGYIKKSPAAAIGVTAALGFALARMVHAGLDQRA